MDTSRLTVLNIGLRTEGSSWCIHFELVAGDLPGNAIDMPLDAAALAAGAEELGAWYRLTLDDTVAQWLRERIRGYAIPDSLWVRLIRPTGGLHLVPWERLLEPLLDIPVLRLPQLPSAALRAVDDLDVAICASMPEAKTPFPLPVLVAAAVEAVQSIRRPRAVAHVFVDAGAFAEVRAVLQGFPADRVRLHDPTEAAGLDPAPQGRPDQAGEIESPWLAWMARALGGTTVDVAHFLCHGWPGDGTGALAFAESSLVNRDHWWARFVGPQQLSAFLDRVGAWSLVLGSPPGNFSPAALYALADQIGQLRPGPLLLYDAGWDTGGTKQAALDGAYRFLYQDPPGRLPTSPALSMRCLPKRPSHSPRARAGATDIPFYGYVLGGDALASIAAEPDTTHLAGAAGARSRPWQVASQRILERTMAELADTGTGTSAVARATRSGIAEAIDFVSKVVGEDLSK